MTRARTVAIGVAAAAALGAFAATVIGGEGPDAPGNTPPPGLEFAKGERVKVPGVEAKQGQASRVIYVETPKDQPISIDPGDGGGTIGKCPKGSSATNGYYYKPGVFESFGLDEQGSFPVGPYEGHAPAPPQKWGFYWENETDGQVITGVILGMVCDRDG